ncbi:SpoVR family protein, partial [Mycobacterium tuberculosis]|nr:SpoVR family protein [Mycobacterium tuberculosis]
MNTRMHIRHDPLPCPSDWSFELIERYNTEIARVAEGYQLDIYPIQVEIITAEEMVAGL